MKREQLSNRIGNIEDRLIEQAENAPNFGRQQRNRNIRRMVSIAAVLVLMVGSFTIGAIAMAKDVIVYVEKEQEIITVGDSGISLILPDSWKEKYGVEQYGNEVIVYHLATRESFGDGTYGGDLFRIFCLEERFPLDYVFSYPGFTIAITETHTYVFNYPSDVQFDWNNPAAMTEYMELSDDTKNIEIVMNAQMLENTMNATNWVEGTVFVKFLEDFGAGGVSKTVVCDAEQSKIITEVVESQDYGEPRSFYNDLWIIVGYDEYYLNSTTGDIMIAAGGYSAVLSAEDLGRIMDALND
jgi:hypothetical protein